MALIRNINITVRIISTNTSTRTVTRMDINIAAPAKIKITHRHPVTSINHHLITTAAALAANTNPAHLTRIKINQIKISPHPHTSIPHLHTSTAPPPLSTSPAHQIKINTDPAHHINPATSHILKIKIRMVVSLDIRAAVVVVISLLINHTSLLINIRVIRTRNTGTRMRRRCR